MAWNNRRGGNSRNKNSRKSKYSQLERLAFNMGKIQDAASRDTRVAASLAAGKASNSKEKAKQKPLC